MKVFELMSILSKVPAGLDVLVNLKDTSLEHIMCFDVESDYIGFTGDDGQILTGEGFEFGPISQIAEKMEKDALKENSE